MDVIKKKIVGKNTTVYQRAEAYYNTERRANGEFNSEGGWTALNPGKTGEDAWAALYPDKKSVEAKTELNPGKGKKDILGDLSDQYKNPLAPNYNEYSETNAKIRNIQNESSILKYYYKDLSKKSYGFSPYYAEKLGTQGQYKYKDSKDKDYYYDTLKSTGERVYVKEVVSKTEDGMKLRLTDGRTVNSDEISFGSNDLAIIFEAAQRSGIATKDIVPIVNTYDGKIDGASYIKAAIDIYDGGTLRDKEYYSDIRNPLTNSQTNKIFALGKAYRDSVIGTRRAKL